MINSEFCYLLITREALEAEIAQLSHKIDNLGARSVCHVHTLCEDDIFGDVKCHRKCEFFCTRRGEKGLLEKRNVYIASLRKKDFVSVLYVQSAISLCRMVFVI